LANSLTEIHFEILGISKQANQDEIKKAYRKQMTLWHPDKFANDVAKKNIADERSKKINEAYSLLKKYIPPTIAKRTEKPYTPPPKQQAEKPTSKERTEINRVRVKSSNIHSIGYSIELKIIQVQFLNGSVYEYYDVPLYLYEAFLKADSKGKFLNGNLNRFKYRQV